MPFLASGPAACIQHPSKTIRHQASRGPTIGIHQITPETPHLYRACNAMNHEPVQQNQPASALRPPTVIRAPVSLGELLDKISILEIKCDHFSGESLANVQEERKQLETILGSLPIAPDPELMDQLRTTNRALWRIEDDIRAHEQEQDFGEAFIELARSVYQQNDRRSAIKRQLKLRHGSALIEEKSYTAY